MLGQDVGDSVLDGNPWVDQGVGSTTLIFEKDKGEAARRNMSSVDHLHGAELGEHLSQIGLSLS